MKKQIQLTLFALGLLTTISSFAMEEETDIKVFTKHFFEAAEIGDLDRIKELIEPHTFIAQKCEQDKKNFTSWCLSLLKNKRQHGDAADIQKLIQQKVKEDEEELMKWTEELLKYAQLDINEVDKHGNTALISTSMNCRKYSIGYSERSEKLSSVIEFLIEHGADVSIQNKDGNTALMYAAHCGNSEICKFLLGYVSDEEAISLYSSFLIGIFALRHAKPALPKDMRTFIMKKVLGLVINDRLHRAEKLMRIQNNKKQTALDYAESNEVASLVDPTNKESQKISHDLLDWLGTWYRNKCFKQKVEDPILLLSFH